MIEIILALALALIVSQILLWSVISSNRELRDRLSKYEKYSSGSK